jgi:hypothetical protein
MEVAKLPVYNKTRLLFIQFERSTQKVPINMKRGAISEVEHWLIEIMDTIAFANLSERDRQARLLYITEAARTLQKVKVRIRTLYDLNIITKKGFDALILLEGNVDKQLTGWERSIINNNA